MIRVYKECQPEHKSELLQQIIKPKQMSESMLVPISINMMVIEVQWVCSMLSEFLGLESDKYVVEVMLGFLLIFLKSESDQLVQINFDKFLADTIHKQLVNFHSLRHFRYYTYLLKKFLARNHGEIPEASCVSTECKIIILLIFINKVMSTIYSLIFNTSLPRFLEDMKIHLQPNLETRVGDWVPNQ
jgi:hypothetical protein